MVLPAFEASSPSVPLEMVLPACAPASMAISLVAAAAAEMFRETIVQMQHQWWRSLKCARLIGARFRLASDRLSLACFRSEFLPACVNVARIEVLSDKTSALCRQDFKSLKENREREIERWEREKIRGGV